MNEREIRIHKTIKKDKGKFKYARRKICLVWDPNKIHEFLVGAGVFRSEEAKRK